MAIFGKVFIIFYPNEEALKLSKKMSVEEDQGLPRFSAVPGTVENRWRRFQVRRRWSREWQEHVAWQVTARPGQFQPDNKTSAGRQGLRVAYGLKHFVFGCS